MRCSLDEVLRLGGLIRGYGVGVDWRRSFVRQSLIMPRHARVQPNLRHGSPTDAERYSMIDQWMVWNGIVWGGLTLTASAMAYSVAAWVAVRTQIPPSGSPLPELRTPEPMPAATIFH